MMRLRKSRRLAHRWPLLPLDQDPASLQSRVAFHLHRLGMTGARLRNAGVDLRTASALTQGRLHLTDTKVAGLASALGVPSDELARNLTAAEKQELTFYRHSAKNARAIWNVVLASFPSLSEDHIADLTGIDRRRLNSARLGKPERPLTWEEAQSVADAVGVNAALLFSLETDHSR